LNTTNTRTVRKKNAIIFPNIGHVNVHNCSNLGKL